jgi:hypothetical protein
MLNRWRRSLRRNRHIFRMTLLSFCNRDWPVSVCIGCFLIDQMSQSLINYEVDRFLEYAHLHLSQSSRRTERQLLSKGFKSRTLRAANRS